LGFVPQPNLLAGHFCAISETQQKCLRWNYPPGFLLPGYGNILSIQPAGAKLFSEVWLILSEE
jgi:hypothetical protein